jgi:hypothetical protein
MNRDNIENIRRGAIPEIKEKIKKNPGPFGYLHPTNKEKLADIKRLNFFSGNDFIYWMQKNRILESPTDINREIHNTTYQNARCDDSAEYLNKCAQKVGFEDFNDRQRQQRYEKGERGVLIETNEDCPSHVGCIIGEDDIGRPILDKIFEYVYKKGFKNPGYDFLCKNVRQTFLDKYPQFKLEINKEYKIDIKTSHFLLKWGYWGSYNIDYNNIADYFMIIGLGADDNIPQFIFFIHKYDIIRGKKFYKRISIKIGKRHLSEFCKYQIRNNRSD